MRCSKGMCAVPKYRLLDIRSFFAVFAIACLVARPASADPLDDRDILALSKLAVLGTVEQKDLAVRMLMARGKPDIVPTLIFAMRYRRDNQVIPQTVSALTSAEISGWPSGMLWQEARPELRPHPSYRQVKLDVYEKIDPKFLRFLSGDRSLPENFKIRFEKVAWSGVPVALAYCTLCGAGIPFKTKVDGRDEPFVLGSSGFLYRSNKLM